MQAFERIPELRDKYDAFERIGEGGMGMVFRARHRFLDEIRVIKTIKPDSADEDALARFLREARIAAKLRHPHIASVHDFVLGDDGDAYIVMEYIEGRNLWEYYRDGHRLERPMVGLAAQQLLDALDYLHGRNFIHRDLSLDNTMLTHGPRGEAMFKIIDLGLAKSLESADFKTKTGIALGKVSYLSPEELTYGSGSDRIDARSDLYSFGILLFQLLTGELPISGTDQASLIAGHLFHPVKSFDVTDPDGTLGPELRSVLLKTLEKKPEDRIASARELSSSLEIVLPPAPAGSRIAAAATRTTVLPARNQKPRPPAARRPAPREPGSAWTRRPRLAATLAVVLAVPALLGGVWVLGRSRAERPASAAAAGAAGRKVADPGVADLEGLWFGNYRALVIGNNRYPAIGNLETAVNDARAVSRLLAERYGFVVTLLEDATREQILDALFELEASLTARDSLLIYYAGHGTLQNQREWWQPVDAEPDDTTNWISTEHEISARIEGMAAKHVLVVADSCYAGSSGTLELEAAEPRTLLERPSRLVLTSGNLSPVIDDSGSRHSIFAQALLDTLSHNRQVVQAASLFEQLAQSVPREAARIGVDQSPTFAPIPRSGDGGGMFFFVPREAPGS